MSPVLRSPRPSFLDNILLIQGAEPATPFPILSRYRFGDYLLRFVSSLRDGQSHELTAGYASMAFQ